MHNGNAFAAGGAGRAVCQNEGLFTEILPKAYGKQMGNSAMVSVHGNVLMEYPFIIAAARRRVKWISRDLKGFGKYIPGAGASGAYAALSCAAAAS